MKKEEIKIGQKYEYFNGVRVVVFEVIRFTKKMVIIQVIGCREEKSSFSIFDKSKLVVE